MDFDRRGFVCAAGAIGASALTAVTPQTATAAPAAPAAAPAATSAASRRWHEQTYILPASLQATWKAWTDPAQRKIWWGYPTDAIKDAAEVRPLRFLRTVVNHPGLPGITQSRQAFTAVPGGTRIVHGLTGFGEELFWQNALGTSLNGVDEMMSDMALFLRTGAGFPRHVHLQSYDLLKGTRDAAGGLEVFEVVDGTLSKELGLQPGDTIVSVGSVAIFDLAAMHAACRAFAPGAAVDVKWVRDGQLMSGKGHMTRIVTLRPKAS